MATSEDIRQLIAILDEEGFGALAGEILTELNLGREIEKDVAPDLNAHGTDVTTLVRIPYDEDDQFAAAMALLDLRLVAPARAMAEAERIASRLGGEGTRLRFVDPVTQVETAPGERRTPGDATAADALADMVARLPNLRAAPLTGDA